MVFCLCNCDNLSFASLLFLLLEKEFLLLHLVWNDGEKSLILHRGTVLKKNRESQEERDSGTNGYLLLQLHQGSQQISLNTGSAFDFQGKDSIFNCKIYKHSYFMMVSRNMSLKMLLENWFLLFMKYFRLCNSRTLFGSLTL